MLVSENDLRAIRERIADQEAVVELIELRDYAAMLPDARRLLTALERIRGTLVTQLAADRRRAGI